MALLGASLAEATSDSHAVPSVCITQPPLAGFTFVSSSGAVSI